MSKTKVIDLHKQLLAEWAKEDKRNLDKIAETITQLKEILNDITVLDTLEAKQALTINRDVVELTLLLSAARATPTSSLNDFEEAAAHTSAFYSVAGGDSPNQAHITGLRLMHLLATHRLVDFHVLLEEIPINDRTQNPYIASPVKLEQSMVEGAYHKVVLTEKNLPSPFYNVFIAILLETIRDEVAQNIEGAFQKIPVGEAARLLLFDTTEKAKSFASKRGWKLTGNFYEFTKTKEEAVQHLDTNGLVAKSLYYAKQLEKIV